MKRRTITVATNPIYFKPRSSFPGLLYAEFLDVMREYQKFERGEKGTRFDTWLPKKKTA